MSEKLKHQKIMDKKEKKSITKFEFDMMGIRNGNFFDIEDPNIDFNLKAEKAFRELFS